MEDVDDQLKNIHKGKALSLPHKLFDFYKRKWEARKSFDQPLFLAPKFSDEGRKHNPLPKLHRIRDFINLWLSYPFKSAYDTKLKAWAHQVSNAHGDIDKMYHLLSENPLRYLEGLVPIEIINKFEACESFVLGKENKIPKPILSLASDLAVNHLLQTLLSGDDDHGHTIHHVMLSTRNLDEGREILEKIKVGLKNEDNLPRFHETFHEVTFVDASRFPGQEGGILFRRMLQQSQLMLGQQIRRLKLNQIPKQNEEQGMMGKKYLLLLLDRYGNQNLDPQVVIPPEHEDDIVTVFITNSYPKQKMDLKIDTKDHLLPWEVFCQCVGYQLVCSSDAIQKIAVQIVEECGGHLFAIVLVAKSLKHVEDVHVWELALNRLRNPNPSYDINNFHGVSRIMINAFINVIWNDINQTQKFCLTSCLFIPGIKIGKLHAEVMRHWISYLLIDAGEATHNLEELVERSVLLQLQGSKGRYIQLPEDIYAILHSLNTINPLFLKKVGLELSEEPDSELWNNAVYIELAENKLSNLPSTPNSLELRVLMLQGNVDLTRIPPMFFFQMPHLCILNLSYTSVRTLPSSFFELEQLRELYLKGCECFMKLPPEIGKLEKLEKLDLDNTQIIHLPEEVQELTNLQSLTLCFYEFRGKRSKKYTSSTIIPSGVITKLKGLISLSIDVHPDDERWQENVETILPEILGLECLQTLSLYIPNPGLLKLIPGHIFELDFRFVVGQHMSRIISGAPPTTEVRFRECCSSLKYVKGVNVPNEVRKVVRHSKALFMDRHNTIKHLSEFGVKNLKQLRECVLAECKEMETIVDGRHSNCDDDDDVLSCLLYLSVFYMKNLRSIWEGPVPSRHILGMLKSLVLHNCPKLRTVFTLDLLGNLSLLKELTIKECPKVSTLISESDELTKCKDEIFLPKLRKVILVHLPELISISNGFHIGPCLEDIGIYDCPKLQSLSKMELSSQNLKVIKTERVWWDALKWNEVEWGIADQSSRFDSIFSTIDKQADVMTQLGAYKNDVVGDDGVVEDSVYNVLGQEEEVEYQENKHQQDYLHGSSSGASNTNDCTNHQQQEQLPPNKKRNTPDPNVEVIALSPKTLKATNRFVFVCEICNKGFQREQNLQFHRRAHNLTWKLRQRPNNKVTTKRVYVCPEESCVHHNPARGLGDITSIMRHYRRKHSEKKWKCYNCSKEYALLSDFKAHQKSCGTLELREKICLPKLS